MKHLIPLLLIAIVLTTSPWCAGQETPDIKLAAKRLSQATVTVRVSHAAGEGNGPAPLGEGGIRAAAERVTVCSGILVGESIIASHVYVSPNSHVRVTLSSGDQAAAKLVAIDEYSGVALLQIDQKLTGSPAWGTEPVAAGQWVVSSAAWGAEEPVVSLGVVSATERSIRGASFPPLIECDMRSADTSSGAGVVNQKGELIGLVAAVQLSQQRGGWTYVVPISHVGRLLRAWQDRPDGESILVLKHRRPVVGMVLTMENGAVIAQRITPQGPAAKAGMSEGDVVLAVDGVKIRSVYDVQRPVLHRQPGDELRLLVQTRDQIREFKVVLGGGVILPPNLALEEFSRWVRPKYDVEQLADGRIVSRNAHGEIRELAVTPADPLAQPPAAAESASLEDKLQLLERALDRYQRVIAIQQAEIDRRGTQQQELEAQLRNLREEVGNLRTRLEQMPAK